MRGAAVSCLLAICGLVFLAGCQEGIESSIPMVGSDFQTQEVGTLRLTSNAFKEGENIPDRYTCKGLDINPQLSWGDVPAETKSFALIMDDPDAPVGLWTHWMVKNIAPDRREIAEQEVPGIEVINSGGRKGYHGPCPPSGTHRYYFRLYALNVSRLEATTKEEFYREIELHKIAAGTLMGRYSKG